MAGAVEAIFLHVMLLPSYHLVFGTLLPEADLEALGSVGGAGSAVPG